MSLLDTIEKMNVTANKKSGGWKPQAFNPNAPRPPSQAGSYFNSRYAGNASDQGRQFDLPPPIELDKNMYKHNINYTNNANYKHDVNYDVGYNMQEVLANLWENFKTNRQRFQEMRQKQIAVFQAMNPPSGNTPAAPEPPSLSPPGAPPGGNGTAPPGGNPGTGEPPPNIGQNPQPGPVVGGGFGDNAPPLTGMPTWQDAWQQVGQWQNPNPILWDSGGHWNRP